MRIYKLLTAAGLAGVLCAGSVFAVTADEIEIAENEVAADQAELDALRNTISDLETNMLTYPPTCSTFSKKGSSLILATISSAMRFGAFLKVFARRKQGSA